MNSTLVLAALVNIALGIFLLTKKHDALAISVPLDPNEARTTWAVIGGIYLVNALIMLSALPLCAS